jgi:F-type H+-transporting ATPase subunit a
MEELGLGIHFNVGENYIYIHDTLVWSFLIVAIVSIFVIFASNKIKNTKPTDKPKGIVLIMEIIVRTMNNFTKDNMGKNNVGFAPYLTTILVFILLANISGLFGLTPPTSDYNVTLALAILTAVQIQFFAIKTHGIKSYFKGFFEPFALMLPMNLIDIVATPLSMSFRLFGNILSGVLIMGLVYSGLGYVAPILTPVLHAYFDLFAGVLQSYIFLMLTAVFISGAIND